jgi:prepilin-type processing-associated H-X9-DG protein
MGPERALLAVYDEPELLREMIAHYLWYQEQFVFPVVEALRPEIITLWEDFCYNCGMLISPAVFREFCAPYYRRVVEVARAAGVELIFVDCDGKVAQFLPLLEEVWVNGLMPLEQVCGNDVTAYRARHPRFIFLGGLEKEIASTGQADRIETELVPATRRLLAARGTFPMFDHGLSTNVGFVDGHVEAYGLGDFDIGVCGDLKYGRTAHSLIVALSKFDGVRIRGLELPHQGHGVAEVAAAHRELDKVVERRREPGIPPPRLRDGRFGQRVERGLAREVVAVRFTQRHPRLAPARVEGDGPAEAPYRRVGLRVEVGVEAFGERDVAR